MSAATVQETSTVLAGRSGCASEWSELDARIAKADIKIVHHDAALADIARQALLTYGKGRHPAALNMGDCASYALAKRRGARLLFKGQDFARTDLAAAA